MRGFEQSYSYRIKQVKKIKRRERFCYAERDSSDESDTQKLLDSLILGILFMQSFVCFLIPATLAFVSFFVFPFCQTGFKKIQATKKFISPP